MSTREDFEPTTLDELISESGYIDGACEQDSVTIRIFSSESQEWGILSVYQVGDDLYFDIEKLDRSTKK